MDNKLRPFRLCVLQNFPYIEEDFDALTDYALLCKIVEYLNNVINSQNIVLNNVTELNTAYENLKNYVDNYFKNLDIQTEINRKLDEMAESGQLREIITQYLNISSVLAYNTVADMKDAENVIDGSFCKTYGLENYKDGKGRFYKIRKLVNTDVIDEVNIIAMTNDDTLVAELIPDFYINELTTNLNGLNDVVIENYDTLNNKIKENYTTLDNKIDMSVTELMSDVSDVEEKITRRYNQAGQRFYIDGDAGDDSNDGSQTHPWKTIDKLFNLLNQGKTDVRCYIVKAGTYIASNNIFTNCVIHITATVPGVVIEFQNPINYEVAFYNSHLNIQGADENSKIKLRLANQDSYTIENCATALKYVAFENATLVDMYGGYFNFEYVEFPRLYNDGANGNVQNFKITGWQHGTAILSRRGGNLACYGVMDVSRNSNSNNLFVCERGRIVISITLPSNVPSSPISTGRSVTSTSGIIQSTTTVINDRLSVFASGGTSYSSAAITVLTNHTIQ
jgi:hypothetical protein